jgi:hypothetical protein
MKGAEMFMGGTGAEQARPGLCPGPAKGPTAPLIPII